MLSTDAAVELRGHSGSVLCLDSDPSRLASASADGSVRLWDLNSCRVARALMLPELAEAQSVVLGRGSGPAANCVFAAADRTIYAYDLRAPAVVLRQPTQLIGAAHEEVAQMALTDDGAQLAAADDAGAVHIFDLAAAGQPPVVLQGHESICATLAFRPPASAAAAGLQLCSGGMDARCVQWDVASASALAEWSLGIAEEPPKAASSGGAGSSEGQEAGAGMRLQPAPNPNPNPKPNPYPNPNLDANSNPNQGTRLKPAHAAPSPPLTPTCPYAHPEHAPSILRPEARPNPKPHASPRACARRGLRGTDLVQPTLRSQPCLRARRVSGAPVAPCLLPPASCLLPPASCLLPCPATFTPVPPPPPPPPPTLASL